MQLKYVLCLIFAVVGASYLCNDPTGQCSNPPNEHLTLVQRQATTMMNNVANAGGSDTQTIDVAARSLYKFTIVGTYTWAYITLWYQGSAVDTSMATITGSCHSANTLTSINPEIRQKNCNPFVVEFPTTTPIDEFSLRNFNWRQWTLEGSSDGNTWITLHAQTIDYDTSQPARFDATAPTDAPTAGPATAVGDPHLVNTRGEHFSIFTSGQVEFIRVPYASVTEKADFTVHATIQSVGATDKCKEAHFITGVLFGGSWFKGKPLEVNVHSTRPGATRKEMKVLLGGVPVLSSTKRIDLGDNMAFHMYDNHKIVLLVDGASVAVELQNFFLNVDAGSFTKFSQKIGGLLGEDDHSALSIKPAGCDRELLAKDAQLVFSSARCQLEVGEAVLESAAASGDPHLTSD